MIGTALVGDIGGTNARFAPVRDGRFDPATVMSFANDDFDDFDAALGYVLGRVGAVDAIAISAAGPVYDGDIRLTNRDWMVTRTGLMRHADRVVLMNDLSAHVLAAPVLPQTECNVLRAGGIAGNGQWCVINLGTGYNAAQGLEFQGHHHALEAERGMTPLPDPIACLLRDAGAEVPARCDDFFSGPGLTRLELRLGRAAAPLFGQALALLIRDLISETLPFEGVYLCGGVAQGIVQGPGRDSLLAGLDAPYAPYGFLADVPVRVMTSPWAALRGCLAALGRR